MIMFTSVGQPVDVCQDFAIVRIALGVESLMGYMSQDSHTRTSTLKEDLWCVKKMAAIAKHFGALNGSTTEK
jgi:hypothetical protein